MKGAAHPVLNRGAAPGRTGLPRPRREAGGGSLHPHPAENESIHHRQSRCLIKQEKRIATSCVDKVQVMA